MRKVLLGAVAVAAAGAALMTVNAVPASAQVARPSAFSIGASDSQVTLVGYRDRSRWRGRSYRHRDNGAAAFGFAAGALLGSAIASQPRYYVDDGAVAYCMQRFRSYDPRSGTYLGYDGLRHPCP